MDGSDCIVVGGGVIGLTTAWRLAARGLSVVVADPAPARGASWAAAGMLAPVTELQYSEMRLLRLNLAAAGRWPAHAAQLADAGHDVGFTACGSLMVARDADDAAELRRLLEVQRQLGMDVEWLRSRDIRALEPGLAPSTRGGIRVDGDHQVDNRALVDALLRACAADPRLTLVDQRVIAVQPAGSGAEVTLEDGQVRRSGHAVIAAGARSAEIKGLDGLAAVRPVKGQLVHLWSPEGPLATRNLRGQDCYVVNRPDGRLVVGATMEEQGFDDRATAGAVRDLLDAAWEVLPGISEATFVEVAVGFRPGTADNGPLLGPTAEPQIVLATGHHRNGVLQSRLTADAVVAWITGEPVPDEVVAFAGDAQGHR